MMPISKNIFDLPKLNEGEILPHGKCTDCKSILNIGFFFDGTDNNRYRDQPKLSHSNVARLYGAYRRDRQNGYFRHYIQGVGTPFPEIGENDAIASGGPWGAGGEARIAYALFQLLNSIYSYVNKGEYLFGLDEIRVLVSHNLTGSSNIDEVERRVNSRLSVLLGGELPPRLTGRMGAREKILMNSSIVIRRILEKRTSTPNISGIYIDVFGFSRGAAEARVFCNWLHSLMLSGGRLCGVPAYVRILGIFDTVASVGFSKSGHYSWATAQNLRIHREIRNCVHFVALHEFRNNFPLDSVYIDGFCPTNCFEMICPGAHSDVGGGYEPGEQGKALEWNFSPIKKFDNIGFNGDLSVGDKYKLSQFFLNQMLKIARKTCENHGVDGNPWRSVESSENNDILMKQFECAPQVSYALNMYFKKCGVATALSTEQAMNEHLALYLAWRYSLISGNSAKSFEDLPSVHYANVTDKKGFRYYISGNNYLIEQLSVLRKPVNIFDIGIGKGNSYAELDYHPKAREIYKRITSLQVEEGIGLFFDQYVHDSYASFIAKFGDKLINGLAHQVAEPRRYITHRGMYEGGDANITAENLQVDSDAREAAT